ncbi:F-box/kelch-repeat protein SKIP11 [Capsicum annuum]|uniref:F-box/kelch-repeat protein SKIP11 n=1 Tax=Capsicum annuum TaxID=4072 RepID=A0A2G2ZHF2_CAPAN|nr:F-box/kelch-repeat protein SKIP11 [Capsicum annuum]XP_047268951.1 F-box/kelch-repeat protein SKIP11 [Capsicum annuum]KAF3644149.1 F-box/kelch-repeat protein SKIP11 [Capsicum annuum]KAF3679794.1 F-box/kelch-repeat protein SKIP11 [Capsicum annuum]PHT81420.1 F-box/kelch-repeat protein SKIP11 [Capsicum annuum]
MLEDRSCLVPRDFPRESNWSACMNYSLDTVEVQHSKRPLVNNQENEVVQRKLPKRSDSVNREVALSLGDASVSPNDHAGNQCHAADNSDSSSLIPSIGRDNSISSLIRCSRSDYGTIASLNHSFRSLIRSGELYRLRRQYGKVEHWVYFSCQLLEWEAFDPSRCRWMHLPSMNPNECFVFSDKESLAVGTELLVFGKEILSHAIYRYSILTNTWSSGMQMNAPRCLFGSASLGEIAILAGGCDSQGNILKSAELYSSETGTWKTLPSMNKQRKMCSAVFMDKKFYVIGGIGGTESKLLTCGEEYDLVTGKWTEISSMSPVRARGDTPAASEAPPLVAVVNNDLYAADYADMEVRKYDKQNKAWATVGRLPERAASMNGWGLAFRACGDRLIVIGGPRTMDEGHIEVNSWIPSEGPPHWNLLGQKRSGSFVYNCAVMGC